MKRKILAVVLAILMAFGTSVPTAFAAGNSTVSVSDFEEAEISHAAHESEPLVDAGNYLGTTASGTCGDNLTWTLDDSGTLTISGSGEMYNYTSSSRAPWYNYRSSITKVIIQDGVTSISNYAFYDCSKLASVTIPDSVTSIGDWAFAYCSSLASVTIPDSVTSIGKYAFEGCSSLASVTIGNSVTIICIRAFYGCGSLASVTIPNSVTSIGDCAFAYCSSLASVTIPDSVTSIGKYAFEGCSSLTSVTIGNGVTSIGSSAFSGCSSLASVTIGKSVTSIGEDAFRSCSSLASVTIPDSVTSIDVRVFWDCSNLTSVTIPNSVTSIGGGTFRGCSSLTSVTIPDSVTSIGYGAFEGCSSLASVTIGKSVTSIGVHAFYNCSRLASVTIPDSVTSIGDYAFEYCNSLKNVYISDLSAWCKIKFSSSYSNPCFYDAALYLNGKLLTDVQIPDNITSIGKYAFESCSSLASVTIPNSVTSIGDCAFAYCSSLASVTIGKSVTSIRGWAFEYCSSLASVKIPDSVTSIGSYAFYYCSSLASVTIPDSVTYIGGYAFSGCSSLTGILVDENNPNYSSDEKGVLFNKAKTTLIQYPIGRTETSYDIPNSVTSIGGGTFRGCSSLTSVIIPDSVTSIGSSAFQSCSSLASVKIPDSVTSIGSLAFESCSSLASVTIGNSVTSIGNWAFEDCSSLTDVYYSGTEEQWNAISIGSGNDPLLNATIHFNYGTAVSVTSVSLSKTEMTLEAGDSETLTVTVLPENATNKNVTWSSSNESVATVTDGVVNAVSAGTATITVTTSDGAKTATCVVTVKAKSGDVSIDQAGGKSYSLFNSGRTTASGYDATYNYTNPAPDTHDNSGYDLYGSINSLSRFRLGLSFTVSLDISEQSILSVKAWDVDESRADCGYGYEYDYIYLVDETTGISTRLDTHLSGQDDTWNTSAISISPALLTKGHTYHFELQMTCTGTHNCGYYAITVRTVDLIINGGEGTPASGISSADLSASISSGGLVSVNLTAAAYEQEDYKIEYKAVCLSDSAQYGGKEVSVTIPVAGNTFTDSFQLESAAPRGSYKITAFIKNLAGSVIASRDVTVGYSYSAVSYNSNGGSQNLPNDTASYSSGSTVTVKFDYIPSKSGYTFKGWSTDPSAVEPTYTEAGNKTFVIGSEDVVLYAVWKADVCTHNWQETSRTDATCTESGRVVYTCSCGATRTEVLPALHHDLVTVIEQEVSCTQDGVIVDRCQRTGCSYEKRTVIHGEHDYKVKETKEPTCTENGYILYACSKCESEYREELTA